MKITDWFVGVVEDVGDGAEIGRVRVRCLGYHTLDRELLPTDRLPWSLVMLPTTGAGVAGVGQRASLIPGSWVFGFFRDGDEKQDPVVIGTIAAESDGSNLGYDSTANFGIGDAYGTFSSHIGNDLPNTMNPSESIYSGVSSGVFGDPNSLDNVQISGDAVNRIIQIARSQVGVTETGGSGNIGPGIEKYWSATTYPTGMRDKRPYCAAFVCWVIRESKILSESERPKDAGVSNFLNWGKSKSYVRVIGDARNVQRGDLVFLKNWSHICIAVEGNDGSGTFRTVCANTAPPPGKSGEGVWEKSRNVSALRAVLRIVPTQGQS